MGEHSGRYATVVDALAPDGWAVYGLDHRGHGRSDGTRVHVRRYADFLADLDTFRRAVVARHPDLRPFLLGHSMGVESRSPTPWTTRTTSRASCSPRLPCRPARAARRPGGRDGAGPGGADAARAVVDLATISRDEAVVTDYRTDALVHQGHPTIALSLALAEQMTLLPARVRDLRLPLLVQHGTDDRICPPEGAGRWRRQWAR